MPRAFIFWQFKIQIPKNFRMKKVPPYLWFFRFQKSVHKILQKLVENLQRTRTRHGLTACNAIIIFLGIVNGLFYGLF